MITEQKSWNPSVIKNKTKNAGLFSFVERWHVSWEDPEYSTSQFLKRCDAVLKRDNRGEYLHKAAGGRDTARAQFSGIKPMSGASLKMSGLWPREYGELGRCNTGLWVWRAARLFPLWGQGMSVGRRAWRPEQPVEGLLGGETKMETVLSRLSWVTGAVLGVPGVQVLWITVECAIDSISSFVPCVHCKRMATKKGKRLKTLTY